MQVLACGEEGGTRGSVCRPTPGPSGLQSQPTGSQRPAQPCHLSCRVTTITLIQLCSQCYPSHTHFDEKVVACTTFWGIFSYKLDVKTKPNYFKVAASKGEALFSLHNAELVNITKGSISDFINLVHYILFLLFIV